MKKPEFRPIDLKSEPLWIPYVILAWGIGLFIWVWLHMALYRHWQEQGVIWFWDNGEEVPSVAFLSFLIAIDVAVLSRIVWLFIKWLQRKRESRLSQRWNQ
jgi:ABC-type Fe3+ transport system permease subunit